MLRNWPDIAQEEFPLFDRNYLAKCYHIQRSKVLYVSNLIKTFKKQLMLFWEIAWYIWLWLRYQKRVIHLIGCTYILVLVYFWSWVATISSCSRGVWNRDCCKQLVKKLLPSWTQLNSTGSDQVVLALATSGDLVKSLLVAAHSNGYVWGKYVTK